MKKLTFVFISILALIVIAGCGGGGSSSSSSTTSSSVTGTVTLNWTAPANNIDVSGYNVYSSLASGGPYTLLNGATLVSATTYTTASIAAGTYYFVVRSVDTGSNESSNSNEVTKTIN